MSQSTRDLQGRAVRVREPDTGDERPDYVDAFDVRRPAHDDRTAEQWIRAGLEGAPGWMRRIIGAAHRRVLRFRLGPLDAADHVLGWRIVASEPDLVRLETSSPLLRAVLVARRVDPSSARLMTLLFYARPATCRIVWALVGPLHRRIAPYLLERAAGGSTRAG